MTRLHMLIEYCDSLHLSVFLMRNTASIEHSHYCKHMFPDLAIFLKDGDGGAGKYLCAQGTRRLLTPVGTLPYGSIAPATSPHMCEPP